MDNDNNNHNNNNNNNSNNNHNNNNNNKKKDTTTNKKYDMDYVNYYKSTFPPGISSQRYYADLKARAQIMGIIGIAACVRHPQDGLLGIRMCGAYRVIKLIAEMPERQLWDKLVYDMKFSHDEAKAYIDGVRMATLNSHQ